MIAFIKSIVIAATGMRAQAGRMRITSEDIANADSTTTSPGGTPYPRRIVTFRNELDREISAHVVELGHVAATAEYLFQYRQWYARHKISVRDMKEEFRQTEGDPAVKGKPRQLRHARMRKRIMAAVPKASAVITNPTHFAIALRYERGMNARSASPKAST